MAASGVLDILRDIEADTLRNAAPLPLKRDSRPEWQGIGFQVSGVRLVAPLSEVSVTAVPCVDGDSRPRTRVLAFTRAE